MPVIARKRGLAGRLRDGSGLPRLSGHLCGRATRPGDACHPPTSCEAPVASVSRRRSGALANRRRGFIRRPTPCPGSRVPLGHHQSGVAGHAASRHRLTAATPPSQRLPEPLQASAVAGFQPRAAPIPRSSARLARRQCGWSCFRRAPLSAGSTEPSPRGETRLIPSHSRPDASRHTRAMRPKLPGRQAGTSTRANTTRKLQHREPRSK